jgi:poly-beta-1,6-N-acetyl-D-glucosamine synthase
VITVLIPAHNEEAGIEAAVRSILDQRLPADRIVVVADNCTDATPVIARSLGAEVYETVGNTHKKAGGLNQVFRAIEPTLTDDDYVFVMDADSLVDPSFLHTAVIHMHGDRSLGGVGGTFRGGSGGGFVGVLQRNEYARYARDVRRLKGKVLVLTGTATLFRVAALRDVIGARAEGELPGEYLYDTKVLTEDNELTLALLHRGWTIKSPLGCTLETEIMPTWQDLAKQRLRWKRGAIENLFDYGLTRYTWRYWGRQVLSLLGTLVTLIYFLTVAGTIWATGELEFSPFWLIVTAVFAAERVVTVNRRGVKQMLLAAPICIEMVYDVFLQAVQARAIWQVAFRKESTW